MKKRGIIIVFLVIFIMLNLTSLSAFEINSEIINYNDPTETPLSKIACIK